MPRRAGRLNDGHRPRTMLDAASGTHSSESFRQRASRTATLQSEIPRSLPWTVARFFGSTALAASDAEQLLGFAHQRLPGHQVDDPVAVERSRLDGEMFECLPCAPRGLRFARAFGAHQDVGRIVEQDPADDFTVLIHCVAPLVTRNAVLSCNGCAR
jgi:hypothetical protein